MVTFVQLVTSGQKDEAVDVLRLIRDHNGSAFAIELADVHDPNNVEMTSKRSGEYLPVHNEDGHVESTASHDSEAPGMKRTMERQSSFRETVQDYFDRLSDLMQSELRKVTLLTWSLWFTASAAYT